MNLPDVPAAIAAVTSALPQWHHIVPERTSRIRDHVWSQGSEVVTLSTWDSAVTSHVQVAYEYAGAEVSHLVLSDAGQITPWLLLVGALIPTQAQVAQVLAA